VRIVPLRCCTIGAERLRVDERADIRAQPLPVDVLRPHLAPLVELRDYAIAIVKKPCQRSVFFYGVDPLSVSIINILYMVYACQALIINVGQPVERVPQIYCRSPVSRFVNQIPVVGYDVYYTLLSVNNKRIFIFYFFSEEKQRCKIPWSNSEYLKKLNPDFRHLHNLYLVSGI